MTAGYMAIVVMGILSCIALLFAALWLLVQFCFLVLASMIEVLQTIGALYAASDPLIRFFVLVSIGYALYRLCQLLRKRGHHENA